MRVDAILQVQEIHVEYEVESFRVVAILSPVVVPLSIGVGAGLELLMAVASERHSAGTFLRGHLHRSVRRTGYHLQGCQERARYRLQGWHVRIAVPIGILRRHEIICAVF